MQLQVRCRCNVMRTIDTGQVGPWRLRCKQCGDVLYDPRAKAAEVPLPLELPREEPSSDEASVGEDSDFQRRLMESAELKVMMSADPDAAEKCKRHPKRPVVAACTRCAALLCKRCLDKIGDEFVCAECVAAVATKRPQGDAGGVMAWFKKLFKNR